MYTKIKKLKKVGGLSQIVKKNIVLSFFLLFVTFKSSLSNIVNDHEIETFLNEIIEPVILSSNIYI